MPIHETAAAFGPEGTLIGVLGAPCAPSSPSARVGCLLLNTGVNHRIGPRRINVKAARRLAAAGIASLRFDLSGIGDSRASGGRQDFRQQALVDMRAALDHFQARTGLARFVVFGICSGAANGLALALADERVVGLCMFDGDIFPTQAVRLERKLRRWAAFPFNPALRRNYRGWSDLAAWARAPLDPQARRAALARLWGRAAPQSTEETGLFSDAAPAYGAADYARDLAKLVARRVDVHMMFSATINAVDHGRDLMAQLNGQPFLAQVRYRFWPDIDHTVTALAAQKKLLDAVCEWAREVDRAQAVLAPASAGSSPAAPRGAVAGPLPLEPQAGA